ncbi:MAG TPA: hypothetical protein VGA78_12475, partial [Gemmatimonadales bacterium]
VALEPLPLDQLELGEGSGRPAERQAEKVWRGLVHAALLLAQESSGGGSTTADGKPIEVDSVSGAQIANAIKSRRNDKAYNREVLDWVIQAGEKVRGLDQSSRVRQAVDGLFAALDRATLGDMMNVGATAEERKAIVRRGARSLPVKTVLDLLDAAATLSEKIMSHTLLRLLGKLAGHVDTARGPIVVGAEDVLRDSVRQLVGEWDEEDPSAHSHRDLLALLARPGGVSRGGASGKAEAGSLRVAQMGLELGVDTAERNQALVNVRGQIRLVEMLDLIDRGSAARISVDGIWKVVGDPTYLSGLLLDEAQDVVPVERVLEHMGHDALNPLLEALEAAEGASRRRWLLRRIQEFGDVTGPRIVARLPGKPWFVQRNLLNLLGTLHSIPPQFRPEEYAAHDDSRVRREAYKLLFANPESRSDAVVRAAGDQDTGIVRLALSAALEQCPQELTARLLEYLGGRYRDQDIRLLAIRLIGKRPTTGGRDWLLRRVASQRGWGPFRRLRLEHKSPEVIAVLVVLRQQFADHAGAASVLRMAEASKDTEIRAASRGVSPGALG